MPFELECDWLDTCTNTSAGMAAHPDKGVIPVCDFHVATFRIPLITRTKEN